MLFTPENAKKVLSGQKTQTRRPCQETDQAVLVDGKIDEVIAVFNDIHKRRKWKVGNVYAVQPGRGKKAIGHIKLLSIRQERVNEISEEDAKAEGVSSWTLPTGEKVYKPEFVSLWDSIYSGGMAYHTGPAVWALTFEKVD